MSSDSSLVSSTEGGYLGESMNGDSLAGLRVAPSSSTSPLNHMKKYDVNSDSDEESEEYIGERHQPQPSQIRVGAKYHVLRRDEWMPAEILQIRFNDHNHRQEYYVHYKGQNKRLDEWVSIQRIRIPHGGNQNRDTSSEDESSFCSMISEDDTEESKQIKRSREGSTENDLVISSPASCSSKMDAVTELEELPSDPLEREHEALTKVKYIEIIQFGTYEIDTWYFSPYPDEYGKQQKLFICEFCLKYMKLEKSFRYHLGQCSWRSPPGRNVYKKDNVAIFEVDPSKHNIYCQNLCLLAKLFLDHKTVFYDVEPFLFYVLCELDKAGAHFVGFFSKEKESPDGHNVACILILPPFQRQGYGKFLIGFSYELSKIEGTPGSPEKPLSDLGRLSYYSYWTWAILKLLRNFQGQLDLSTLSKITGITERDILECFDFLNLVKYWTDPNTLHIARSSLLREIHGPNFKKPRLEVDLHAVNMDSSSSSNLSDLINNDDTMDADDDREDSFKFSGDESE